MCDCLWSPPAYVNGEGVGFPGPAPGNPVAEVRDDQMQLGNAAIEASWSLAGGSLRPLNVQNRLTGQTIDLRGCELFRLSLADGKQVAASELKMVGRPSIQSIAALPQTAILAGHFAGKQLTARLASADGSLEIQWRAVLREEGNAIRQQITLLAKNRPILVQAMQLIELPRQGAEVVGSVPGSPLLAGDLFFAYEHPDSQAEVGKRARAVLKPNFTLTPGQPVTQISAIGAVPKGQLRRGFLYYVERERAHPYRPFLHYNSWYDTDFGGAACAKRAVCRRCKRSAAN